MALPYPILQCLSSISESHAALTGRATSANRRHTATPLGERMAVVADPGSSPPLTDTQHAQPCCGTLLE
jgi:hypothetical protein